MLSLLLCTDNVNRDGTNREDAADIFMPIAASAHLMSHGNCYHTS